MTEMWLAAALAVGTLISEDAALAGAAGLVHAGALSPVSAAVPVALGIWLGDLGLFAAGRLATRWTPLRRYVDRRWPPAELRALAARLEGRAAWAILASRALPGTRVPLYVAAGVFRLRASVFCAATATAVSLWTVAVIAGVSWLR